MNSRNFRIGPGTPSLLLIISVLCMSILGVLSFLNARQDCQLSSRSLAVSAQIAQLNANAEASLSKLDAVIKAHPEGLTEDLLPEGMTLEENRISWEETSDTRTLCCAVSLPEDGTPIHWIDYRLLTDSGMMGE